MGKRKRFYVGRKNQIRTVFAHDEKPTKQTHPEFEAVVGAFKTKRGAEYMARHGGPQNPHLLTVADAEKAANAALLTNQEVA